MTTVEATSDNIEKLIDDSSILIVDFWAEWCGPCRAFGPVFEAAAQKHTDVTFAKCDTEAQKQLAAGFGVRAIPMLAVFRDKVLLFAEAGALPAAQLEDLITQVKALDMAKVHADIAAEDAKEAKPVS